MQVIGQAAMITYTGTWVLEHYIEQMRINESGRSTLLKHSTVQETRWLPHRLFHKACEGKKPNSESITSVMITGTISSHESSTLAICGPLNVSAHCWLVSV